MKKLPQKDKDKEGKYHALPAPLSRSTDLAKVSASVIKDHLKGQTIVVFVYSPMCGYCEAMRSEWDDAAKHMARNGIVVVDMDVRNTHDPNVPLARVAAEGLNGVPHLIAIRGNNIDTYQNERTSKMMQSWAKSIRDKKAPVPSAAPKKKPQKNLKKEHLG